MCKLEIIINEYDANKSIKEEFKSMITQIKDLSYETVRKIALKYLNNRAFKINTNNGTLYDSIPTTYKFILLSLDKTKWDSYLTEMIEHIKKCDGGNI